MIRKMLMNEIVNHLNSFCKANVADSVTHYLTYLVARKNLNLCFDSLTRVFPQFFCCLRSSIFVD